MSIAAMLSELRKQQKYSQTEVAQYCTDHGCPVTQKAVSKWERGTTMPDAKQFLVLCKLYGVSDVLTVFYDSSADNDKTLNELGKQRLLEYLHLLQSNDKYLEKPTVRRIIRQVPLYDLPVSAGTGLFLDSDQYELIDIDDSVPQETTFAVRVSGDSMEPRYQNGQILYIKQQQTLNPGEYGIFLLNGDAYCKQLDGQNKNRLISINPDYAPIVVHEYDELRVLGKVLA